jgi:hypothetical protein
MRGGRRGDGMTELKLSGPDLAVCDAVAELEDEANAPRT